MGIPALLTAILTLPLLASSETCEGVSILTRNRAVVGRNWAMEPDGRIRVTTGDGAGVSLAAGDLWGLIGEQGTSRPPALPRVVLIDGEIITGQLAADPPAGHVSPVSPLWGRLDIPIDQGARYTLAATPPAPPSSKTPLVILRNGDTLSAELDRVGPARLTVNTEFGPTEMALSDVAEIVLSARAPSFDARRPEQYLIELTDGQRVYCDGVSAAGERLGLTRGDRTCEIDPHRVRLLVWPGAGVGRLSAMEYVATGAGYFGQPVEPRRDGNAQGRPLQLGQRWFEHGFGTRPESRMVFDLAGRWGYLTGLVGLDPTLGRRGDCVIAVTVDGQARFRAVLQGQDAQAPFAIPLGGGARLGLSTDFGASGDLGDYVNWCDLILIGPRQPATASGK